MKHAALVCLALAAFSLRAEPNALTLVKKIPLPGVHGRIDHFALDLAGGRLFVAALGNDSVEVIDVAAGRRLRSLGNCSTPQGLAYVPGAKRLFIANGGNGTVNLCDGTHFEILKSLGDLPDADNVRCDAEANVIYAGFGGGALAVIGATHGELIAKIPLAGHPEAFQLEKTGNRIFANVPDANQIAVVDRDRRVVVATWPMVKFHANFPMALDETSHRLFVGCRHPARLVVLDTTDGREVGNVAISSDVDDVFYDAVRKRIYASCGGGFIDVIDQRPADAYELREKIPTARGARTSFFSPERGELYLAVRAGVISGGAEIRIFKCN